MSARRTRSGSRRQVVIAIAAAVVATFALSGADPAGLQAADSPAGALFAEAGAVGGGPSDPGPLPADMPLADDGALDGGIAVDVGPSGVVYASADTFGGGRWIVALDAAGRARPGWPVQLTPGSRPVVAADGTAFVLACGPSGCRLHALTIGGAERRGWPALLEGAVSCDPPMPGARDVYVVCRRGATGIRVFRFALGGPLQRGWPADVPGETMAVRRVDLALSLIAAEPGGARLVSVWADGTVHRGLLVGTVGDVGGGRGYAIGEDGTAYAWGHRIRGLTASGFSTHVSSTLIAFDRGGVRAGWPFITRTPMSDPAIANGTVYVTLGTPSTHGSLVALDRAGRMRTRWPIALPVPATTGRSGAGVAPWHNLAGPSVGPDGTVYVTSISGGTTVVAVSPAGWIRPGWPYRTALPLVTSCVDVTGCGDPRVAPLLAPGGVVYVPVRAGSGAAARDRIVRLGAAGRVSAGWPVVAGPATTHVTGLTMGPSGTLLVTTRSVASAASVSLVALDAAGRVRSRTTLVTPSGPSAAVGAGDNGSTRTMHVGDRFLLALPAGYDWTVSIADPAILGRVLNITVPQGAQGVYQALRPGTTTLSAVGDPLCRRSTPPCAAPSILFELHVVVE